LVFRHLSMHWQAWSWTLVLVVGIIAVGVLAHRFIFILAGHLIKRRPNSTFFSITRHFEDPALFILLVLLMLAISPMLPLPAHVARTLRHIGALCVIGCVGWLFVALTQVVEDWLSHRHSGETRHNLIDRRIRTQVQVLRRIANTVIVVVTVAVMLMTFPAIRHIGESLLASAGLAALIAGFAARSTLGNLAAGIQIALTQPIRLDDAVVVEGEWGWIEEISLTYVVVRIWDLRRLIVPVSYFIEKPFQNWTRKTSDLLGTVFIYGDYTLPVDAVRSELHRILESSKLWDGKVWGLEVTNASDRTMELRALMSAPDSPQAWDLRCYVREKLLLFLQENYPQSLPRTRAELTQVQPSELSARDERAA